jgi:hypothetical protein
MGKLIKVDFTKRSKDLNKMLRDLREQRQNGLSDNQKIRVMLDKYYKLSRFKTGKLEKGD